MDKAEILEGQMLSLAQIGQEFYSNYKRAESIGLDSEFLNDTNTLIALLSGSPDSGAIQAMNDADRDVVAVEQYLKKWSVKESESEYRNVINSAKNTLIVLAQFRDTVNSLSVGERLQVASQVSLGRAAKGKGCMPIILLLIFPGLGLIGYFL